jgi:hypothetical protein
LEQPLLEDCAEPVEDADYKKLRRRMRFAMVSSLVANIVLLVAKVVAYGLSSSKAVLASATDSFVDIASQVQTTPKSYPHVAPEGACDVLMRVCYLFGTWPVQDMQASAPCHHACGNLLSGRTSAAASL